jgi:hypothetical protein
LLQDGISTNHTPVTLVRNPLDRIISAFLFENGGMLDGSSDRSVIHKMTLAATYPIVSYANVPGIASCQTKIVMGHFCQRKVTFGPDEVEEAKRRLRDDFLFVGLTEEPSASADLFVAMFGRGSLPLDFTQTKTRVNGRHSSSAHKKHQCELTRNGWYDEADVSLYEQAQVLFYARCRQYGVKSVVGFPPVRESLANIKRKCDVIALTN